MVDDPFYRRVLILSPYPEALVEIIERGGDRAIVGTAEDAANPTAAGYDWLVSFGCREILPPATLARYPDHAVNLHLSYLPHNRGADPNYWAHRDGTPHGVTLHHMDSGIDTGDIIAQETVPMSPLDTLSTSYLRLFYSAVLLFETAWPSLRAGTAKRRKQPGGGSIHRKGERPHLPRGWDTPVREIAAKRSKAA